MTTRLALLATVLALPLAAASHAAADGPSGAVALAWPMPSTAGATHVSPPANGTLRLDAGRDYVIDMPAQPYRSDVGLMVLGGRNVTLIGGEIHVPGPTPGATGLRRALYFKDQTGTVHVEGLRISGQPTEGIDLSLPSPTAVVVLQNIHVDLVTGAGASNHPDLLQTWAGPSRLLIDGFTGTSDYQGFFLMPNERHDGPAPAQFDLRHVDIDVRAGAYALWRQPEGSYPLAVRDVWVAPGGRSRNQYLWPKPSTGDRSWQAVREGSPAGGDFVPADRVGIGYVPTGRLASAPAPVPATTTPAPPTTAMPSPSPSPSVHLGTSICLVRSVGGPLRIASPSDGCP